MCVQAQRHVTDLYEDLRDGHNLISLLEVLSGETLVSIVRKRAFAVTLFSTLGCLFHSPNLQNLVSVLTT